MSDQRWPPRRPGGRRRAVDPEQSEQVQQQGQQPYAEWPYAQQPHPEQGVPERPSPEQRPNRLGRPGQQPLPGRRRAFPEQSQQPYPEQQAYPQDAQQGYPDQQQGYPQDPQQPHPGQQPYPRRRYPSRPYPSQQQAYPQDPQQPYPEQPYPEQPYAGQHYPDQPYGGQPYGGQRFPDQHHPAQPYAGQHPGPYPQDPRQPYPADPRAPYPEPYPETYPGQQPPAYAQGPGRHQPEAPKKRSWPKVLLTLLVLALVGVVGYGAYDFYDQTQTWKQTATDDLDGLGSDLSVAVASMRTVGWEVTPKDLSAALQRPATADDTGLRTVATDEASKSLTVAGYRTWQDTYAKRDHTTKVCASITLGEGTKTPIAENITDCPDSTPKSAPTAPADAKPAGANDVAGHLADLVGEASERRAETGASSKLLDVAAPTMPVGNMRADSTALRCAPGTKDIGEAEGYDAGKLIPVRLCAVENLPNTGTESTKGDPYYLDGSDGLTVVNARISGAAAALVKKASKQGLDLVAGSSFRTMEKQKALCAADLSGGCPSGDYTLTAQPGHSSHQLGIAIDFEEPSVTGGKTCATRATQPSSPVWTFLNKVALGFGLKQYAPEAWHWDAYGGKDRCSPR